MPIIIYYLSNSEISWKLLIHLHFTDVETETQRKWSDLLKVTHLVIELWPHTSDWLLGLSFLSYDLTASFLILQSVRSQNVSRKHYLNIVVIIQAAVPWFSRCGLWIPGWSSVKSRLFLWRCYLSRSPCCHLHRLVSCHLARLVQWLPGRVSDAKAHPALRARTRCCSCSRNP